MMETETLLSILKAEFDQSTGAGTSLKTSRKKAWDRYCMEKIGNEIKDQSQVRTSDVSDGIDGTLPTLMKMFTTADNLVSFDAVGEEDEKQAEQETDYVTHVFFKENDAFWILFSWMFDGLIARNGYVAASWDDSETVSEETYADQSIEQLTALFDDKELTAIEREDGLIENTFTVTFRRVVTAGRIHVEPVPPNEMRISGDATGPDLNKPRLVGRERMIPRTDLIGMGFDPLQIKELTAVVDNSAKKGANNAPVDKSQENILVQEAYLKVDWDEDGRAELRQVYTGSGKLLRWKDGTDANSIVDRQPYHSITPGPLPHQHEGRSSADKTMELQDTTTTLLRGALDNLYRTNNPGHGVWEQGQSENTLDDLMGNRIGGITRFGRPPSEAYMPMTVPFTAAATFPVLQYFDEVKRDRTGVSNDGEGLSPDALKNIQTTVLAQSYDKSQQKIEMQARVFAETGFKSLFRHIHEMASKHDRKERMVKLRNEWVPVNPGDWKTRLNMTVNIGLGIGTREQNLLHLEAVSRRQIEQAQGGGLNLTVTPQNIWQTNKEFVKNARLQGDPAKYFTDPGDKLAPPPGDEQAAFEKEKAELEKRRQQLDADRNEINKQKLQLANQEMQLNHQREIAGLEEKSKVREDKFDIENEKLRNQIAEMQMTSDAQPVKDDKTRAEVRNLDADTQEKNAKAGKVRQESRAIAASTDADESGLLALAQAQANEQADENGEGTEDES